ncbi:HNH endonuclease [Rhizobium indicum]|uniref:HNH endonuclease n=1 Tax=Rhizobium indicum TaxID=2583231 RepID=A0ABX6PQ34_9HYPH|nr:HNH endonuclease [Rhizobium indicum]QKK20804.1 HNH endonuclease [Rhizobium indicum]
MRYLFQRIVHNDGLWQHPSGGRLNSIFDKGYVADQGFAHEDWNFAHDVSANEDAYGYCYYVPADPLGKFCIAFATYEGKGIWSLAGLYEKAVYDPEGASFDTEVLRKRAEQIVNLQRAGHIAGEYHKLSPSMVFDKLKEAQSDYRWRLHPQDIKPLAFSITIPSALLPTVGWHFSRPTEISANEYGAICRYARANSGNTVSTDYQDGGETEFPEGGKMQRQHYQLERNPAVVRIAKKAFHNRHGRFFCQVCNFDFHKAYGAIGANFIEAHHSVPVCEMRPGDKTKPGDMMMLCSNCHRMVHRIRPWQNSVSKLKALLAEVKEA